MTKPTNSPVSLSQNERSEIAEKMATCPFVGTAVATGRLRVLNSAEDPLAEIDEIARLGDLGGGDLGSHVLKLFARGNHSLWVKPMDGSHTFVPDGTFSLLFGGSQGAHAGHSGILLGNPEEVGNGRLDQTQFERLVRYVDRDERLSIDSIGDFIAENLRLDPNARVHSLFEVVKDTARLLDEFADVVLRGDESEKTEAYTALTALLGDDHLVASAGEWGLLFAFLKNSPNSKDGDIALSDVREMFVHKRFPAGWETWKKDTFSWIKATLRLSKDAVLAYYAGWE